MKRLMTAAMAVTLMCGGAVCAYAQDAAQPPAGDPSAQTASPPAGRDQSGPAPQGPDNTGPAQQGSDTTGPAQPNMAPGAGQAGPDQAAPAPPPPAAGAAPDTGTGQVATDTPDGQPPASYPPCKSRGQDRCVQTGHMAASSHAKSHHHMMKKPAA